MFPYLRNCSLFSQLIVPMIVVGVIGASAIVVSAFMVQNSVAALGEMYAASGNRLKILQDIDKGITTVRALSLRHLASESAQNMAQIRTDLVNVEQRVLAYLPNLAVPDLPRREATGEQPELLSQALAAYLAGIDRAVMLSSDFEKEPAFELLTAVENRHLGDIRMAMRTLIQQAIEEIADSREHLIATTNRSLKISFGIVSLGGLMLLLAAFYVSRRASRRISELLRWSQRIADGDLSNQLVSKAGDEVGQLTNAMGSMVRSLAGSRRELEKARKDAEQTAEELRLYANAFDSSGEAMLISDPSNRIINVNATFVEQTGYTLDEVRGKNPRMLSSGTTPRAVYEDMWRSLQEHGYWSGEVSDRRKTGEAYPKWASISAIRDDDQVVKFYIASYSDISERKASEARIDYLAHHDPLTGLINRYNLENRLDQALRSAQRDNRCVAVMFIDMDRFKNINDSLGHHIGDQLLMEVGRRLQDSVRDSDIVARLGGDEFIVVLTRIKDEMDAAPIAEKIQRSLGRPYSFDGKEMHTSPSIGIAVYPRDGEDGPTLMKNADTAMYHVKDHGRNNVEYFTSAMNVIASERLELETDLRQALRDGDLHLVYQPQVSAADGRCIGVEVLARWHHPRLGDIPPLRFIPIAEESGLIETLGEWVLDEACRQLSAWRAEGIDSLRIAVNLSAHQLRSPDLVASVAALLQRHGLTGHDLQLEITESVAMEDPDCCIGYLQALRDIDIELAIDDFGTGYSSLAYLKRLPIQVLKLDRAFVRDIETDPSDAEISAATLALAHNLGLKVTAEGVETEAQRDYLLQHRCDFMQGFLFSKPLTAGEALDFIRKRCDASAA
jgi:diguanylate cyclase (GGDEF)-like protein/PAS domain S-box-containing protein